MSNQNILLTGSQAGMNDLIPPLISLFICDSDSIPISFRLFVKRLLVSIPGMCAVTYTFHSLRGSWSFSLSLISYPVYDVCDPNPSFRDIGVRPYGLAEGRMTRSIASVYSDSSRICTVNYMQQKEYRLLCVADSPIYGFISHPHPPSVEDASAWGSRRRSF